MQTPHLDWAEDHLMQLGKRHIMRADSTSWKHLPAPSKREPLGFEALFTDSEAAQLMSGLIPEQMEDKWFIYHEDGWLRFHRSWTGAFVYALRIEQGSTGFRVVESWVNRDPEQYNADDTAYDSKLVRFLIDAFLLKKSDVIFPMPSSTSNAPTGVVQHSYVGRGYPESTADDDA